MIKAMSKIIRIITTKQLIINDSTGNWINSQVKDWAKNWLKNRFKK